MLLCHLTLDLTQLSCPHWIIFRSSLVRWKMKDCLNFLNWGEKTESHISWGWMRCWMHIPASELKNYQIQFKIHQIHPAGEYWRLKVLKTSLCCPKIEDWKGWIGHLLWPGVSELCIISDSNFSLFLLLSSRLRVWHHAIVIRLSFSR